MPAKPRSFWRTPTRREDAPASSRLSSVVLPAPRKPATRVRAGQTSAPV
jgi:hypothetical protein